MQPPAAQAAPYEEPQQASTSASDLPSARFANVQTLGAGAFGECDVAAVTREWPRVKLTGWPVVVFAGYVQLVQCLKSKKLLAMKVGCRPRRPRNPGVV